MIWRAYVGDERWACAKCDRCTAGDGCVRVVQNRGKVVCGCEWVRTGCSGCVRGAVGA